MTLQEYLEKLIQTEDLLATLGANIIAGSTRVCTMLSMAQVAYSSSELDRSANLLKAAHEFCLEVEKKSQSLIDGVKLLHEHIHQNAETIDKDVAERAKDVN